MHSTWFIEVSTAAIALAVDTSWSMNIVRGETCYLKKFLENSGDGCNDFHSDQSTAKKSGQAILINSYNGYKWIRVAVELVFCVKNDNISKCLVFANCLKLDPHRLLQTRLSIDFPARVKNPGFHVHDIQFLQKNSGIYFDLQYFCLYYMILYIDQKYYLSALFHVENATYLVHLNAWLLQLYHPLLKIPS